MIKEELEKEAYLFAKNSKDVQNFECGFDIAFKSYLASAEPREKRIAELAKENTELKCECRTCVYTDSPCVRSDYPSEDGVCSHYKNVLDENVELKQENKVLAQNLEDTEILNKTYEKRFNDLEKENAELKLKLEALEGQTPWKDIKDKSEVIGQLAKAKDYIKLLLMNCVGVYESTGKTIAEIQAEAEQFLNNEIVIDLDEYKDREYDE